MWFQANSLKMNPEKTDFTLFGTKSSIKKTATFHINLSGTTIHPSTTVKVLGVFLDQHLTWEAHISAIVRRCNAILVSLFKIRHHLNHEVLKLLVCVHVFPHIQYCLSVWGGAVDCHMNRIQKVIHFAARLVTGVRRYEHISPALETLGWISVTEMVRRHDCVNVFRALHESDSPSALRSLFTTREEAFQRSTRASTNGVGSLHLPRVRLTATQRQFPYRAAAAWNKLSQPATHAPSRRAFLSIVKT